MGRRRRRGLSLLIALAVSIEIVNPVPASALSARSQPRPEAEPPLASHIATNNLLFGLADTSLKASAADPGLEKRRAVDGDPTSRWSPPDNQGPSVGHYWAADLGQAETALRWRLLTAPPAPPGDYASALDVYASNLSAAWSWLPSGKLSGDPTENGWYRIGGYSGLAFPVDTGQRSFASAKTYRYWLFAAAAGGPASTDEFDINEVELWADFPGEQTFGTGNAHGNRPVNDEYDPVNTATGNFTTQVTDFTLPGRGLSLAFMRTYNSLSRYAASGGPINRVRFPVGGTTSYTASREFSADYAAPYAADGITGNTDAIQATWAVNTWQAGDWWQVSWSEPQALNRIVLCDRRLGSWYFGSAGRITFSDGSTVNWSGLPDDCGPAGEHTLNVEFPRKTGISWFRVIADAGGTGNAGLAEVEAYDDGPALGSGPSSPNFVRFPVGGTTSYTASREFSADYAAPYAADGITGNTDAIQATWAVNTWQGGDWWQVSWSEPQALNRIVLCDRRLGSWYFGSAGRITFSDGSTVNWSGLPDDCGPAGEHTLNVEFPRKTGISWFRLIADAGGTGNAGLAEVEAYDDPRPVLGSGWTHSYSALLDVSRPTSGVRFFGEDGSQILYQPDESGGYVAPPGVFSSLTSGSGGYELVRRDQLRYRFDLSGRLEQLSDRNGNALTFGYVDGQLSTITDTVGRVVTLAYANGRLTSLAGPQARSVSYGYDADGRLSSATDATGAVRSYAYDAAGRLTTITDPNAHLVVTNEYGVDGRVSAQTNATGDRGTFAWDPATQTSTYTDANGGSWIDVYAGNVLQSSTDPLGNTTSYAYDADFNRNAITDPRGNTTSMTYDPAGNLLTRTAPAPLSYTETWTYTALNDLASYTDGRGNTTTHDYDAAGNLIRTTAPLSAITEYGRDPAGTGLLVSVTDPRGKTTSYAYDAQANLTSTTSPLGHVTTMTYDAAGRMITLVDPRGNEAGADPAEYTTTFSYDAADRLLTITDPLGNLTTTVYDPAGNRSSVTDPKGHTTSYGYDAADRLTAVTDAAGGVTAYAYDPVGNLVTRIDANDHVTTYGYDLANHLTTTADPLGNDWTLTYDAAGNLATRTDANGQTTSFGYDELNRLTSVDYVDPATPDVAYAYDANSNQTSITDGAGTETYGYDELNRLTAVTRGGDTFSYGYDPGGYLTSRTYPGQATQSFVYDDDGRLTSANGATYTYDAAANLLTAATTDGFTARYSYDRAGRMLEVAHTSATATLSRFTYALDPVGNRTAMTTREGTVTYRYDALDRLVEACWSAASCPGGAPAAPLACLACVGGLLSRPAPSTNPPAGETYGTYTYDPVGNRLTEASDAGTTSYAYDVADRLISVTASGGAVTSYTFDANGNQLSAGSVTYTYDATDRLKTATVGGTTETYTYAGDGTRLSASTGAQANNTTKYLWDRAFGLPQLAIERNGNDALLRAYRYGLGLLSQTASSKTYWYHHDGLGSVVDITNSTDTSVTWSEYYPYGLVRQAATGPGAPAVQPFNFTGEQLDPVTGLYHLRARQYDVSTGRFLTTDPLKPSLTDGYVSSYVYVRNMPTMATDPNGTCLQFGGAGLALAPITGGSSAVIGGGATVLCAAVVGALAAAAVVGAWTAGSAAGEALVDASRRNEPPRQDTEIVRRHQQHIDNMYSGSGGSVRAGGLPSWCAQHRVRCAAYIGVTVAVIDAILIAATQGRNVVDPPRELPRRGK